MVRPLISALDVFSLGVSLQCQHTSPQDTIFWPYLSGSPRDRPSKERQLGKKNCLKQTIARPSCPPYQASCF